MTAEAEKQIFDRLSKERAELREGMIAVMMAWSSLETSLAVLLRILLRDRSGALAFAIFFAPQSFEAGYKIVTAAMDAVAGANSEFEKLQTVWRKTKGSVNELKSWRNAVAHGSISTVHINESHIRLTPNIFDWRQLNKKGSEIQHGIDGLELRTASQLIYNASNLLSGFSGLFEALSIDPKAEISTQLHDLATARDKLHTQVISFREGGPTPQGCN